MIQAADEPQAGAASHRCGGLRMARGGLWLAALLCGGCSQGEAPRAAKAVEVVVTRPITDEVTDYQDFTGRFSAFKTVEIRARVTGYVTDAPFKEGDLVHEGDVLFQVDPRSYEADAKQAAANVKVAEAERNIHEKNAGRAQRLFGFKSISQEDYDVAMASVEKDIASVEAAKASRERAKLYLDWTRVTAPLSGRISRRLVDPGNLITADVTILTTIVTEDPMYVYFDVDERTYLDLIDAATPGMTTSVTGLQFPVLMRLANEEQFTHAGVVNFIDNQVSASTGTIRMRGVFPNPKGHHKAGLFARIRLPIGASYQALLIPDEALMSDQGRKFVYVLNDKNEIAYRRVKLGQSIQELRVVKEGLKEGEQVLVSGMQRVRPGMQVAVKTQAPPARPDSPLNKLLSSLRAPAVKADVGAQ
jgi:RND family efflux transporter MFP subunit